MTTLKFDSSDLTALQLSQIALDTTHYAYYLGSFVGNNNNFVNANGDFSANALINYGLSNDSVLSAIVTDLMNGLIEATNYDSSMALINAYENYFISNEYLNSDQQKAVFMGLSVGKYSLAMWTDAYSVGN